MNLYKNKKPFPPWQIGHWTEDEIGRMSKNQVFAIISQGLAEVCYMMDQDPKFAYLNSRDLKRMANEFQNLSMIFVKFALKEGSLKEGNFLAKSILERERSK